VPDEGAPLNRLDPRAPLVLDTRELGRRAGSMRQVHLTVQAPTGLGLDVIGVPAGSDLDLDLRLESVVEGVLVTGTVRAGIQGECVRCLDGVVDDIELDAQELYHYPSDDRARPVQPAGDAEDEEISRVEGDYIDLEPLLRDAIVLALPLQPVCRDDCPGLCSECGARLADEPAHHHDAVDPRWAALAALSSSEPNTERTTEKEG
jgi:uncharacterized protein